MRGHIGGKAYRWESIEVGGHISGALAGRGAPKKIFIFQIETLKRLFKFSFK